MSVCPDHGSLPIPVTFFLMWQSGRPQVSVGCSVPFRPRDLQQRYVLPTVGQQGTARLPRDGTPAQCGAILEHGRDRPGHRARGQGGGPQLQVSSFLCSREAKTISHLGQRPSSVLGGKRKRHLNWSLGGGQGEKGRRVGNEFLPPFPAFTLLLPEGAVCLCHIRLSTRE